MMSTLKPHLLFETSDMLIDVGLRQMRSGSCTWRFLTPKDICALALSSSYGFKIVGFLLRNHLTSLLRDDEDLLFLHPRHGKFPFHFRMSERYHIDTLLRMAGECCTAMANSNYGFYVSFDWQKPLFDGFTENDIITASAAFRDGNVFHAVAQSRDVYDEIFCPMLPIGLPPQLTFVGDGVIKNLIIPKLTPKVDNAMAFAAWKNLKIERIEFSCLEGTWIRRDIFHPHSPRMAYLKSLHVDHHIFVEAVTTMLEQYHQLDEVFVGNANFEHMYHARHELSDPKRYMFYIRTKVEALWNAIVNHPGKRISVVCYMLADIKAFEDLSAVFSEVLPSDFIISQNLSQTRATLRRVSGSKIMRVLLFL